MCLGAEHDGTGALTVDAHNRTTVPGLYAAGGVVKGLDQVVVAMGHGAIRLQTFTTAVNCRPRRKLTAGQIKTGLREPFNFRKDRSE